MPLNWFFLITELSKKNWGKNEMKVVMIIILQTEVDDKNQAGR